MAQRPGMCLKALQLLTRRKVSRYKIIESR